MENITPKEISHDFDTDIHYASFSYNDGISYAEQKGLNQTTKFGDLDKGTHFIVSCGDVLVAVNHDDFPEIERRVL